MRRQGAEGDDQKSQEDPPDRVGRLRLPEEAEERLDEQHGHGDRNQEEQK